MNRLNWKIYIRQTRQPIEKRFIQHNPSGQVSSFNLLVALSTLLRRLYLDEYISKILRKNELNAHSFRHTHATQLIENGASAKAVAGRLGHANTQITQNLYTHNTQKLQEETVAIFDKTLQTK